MATINITVRFRGKEAVRDPLFWLGLVLYKISFGRFGSGRIRRYMDVN